MNPIKSITRHSIVKYKGELFMLENKPRKVLLIRADGTGIELPERITQIEVVMHPAQLAMLYLQNKQVVNKELDRCEDCGNYMTYKGAFVHCDCDKRLNIFGTNLNKK